MLLLIFDWVSVDGGGGGAGQFGVRGFGVWFFFCFW